MKLKHSSAASRLLRSSLRPHEHLQVWLYCSEGPTVDYPLPDRRRSNYCNTGGVYSTAAKNVQNTTTSKLSVSARRHFTLRIQDGGKTHFLFLDWGENMFGKQSFGDRGGDPSNHKWKWRTHCSSKSLKGIWRVTTKHIIFTLCCDWIPRATNLICEWVEALHASTHSVSFRPAGRYKFINFMMPWFAFYRNSHQRLRVNLRTDLFQRENIFVLNRVSICVNAKRKTR